MHNRLLYLGAAALYLHHDRCERCKSLSRVLTTNISSLALYQIQTPPPWPRQTTSLALLSLASEFPPVWENLSLASEFPPVWENWRFALGVRFLMEWAKCVDGITSWKWAQETVSIFNKIFGTLLPPTHRHSIFAIFWFQLSVVYCLLTVDSCLLSAVCCLLSSIFVFVWLCAPRLSPQFFFWFQIRIPPPSKKNRGSDIQQIGSSWHTSSFFYRKEHWQRFLRTLYSAQTESRLRAVDNRET
jgi:hypothetical protein